MGRLSTHAKNRILNLRFQKCFRIKQIAQTLLQEDSIKVSRKSISTFLKKYIETKSINDKPRSGRNKKLTPEEINLIGEVTRLNRDITAPKIKEYLNLNVSTYTILRASKLFEWNKLNPNSNQAKKEAAMQRKQNSSDVDAKSVKHAARKSSSRKKTSSSLNAQESVNNNNINSNNNSLNDSQHSSTEDESGLLNKSFNTSVSSLSLNENHDSIQEDAKSNIDVDPNLNLIAEEEILMAKNVSSSPMVFTTKMLYKLFRMDELLGHNVSGKTFNKYIKNKKALDEKRINYIRWLVERYFEPENREEMWKACRTAINKTIRNHEIKEQQLKSKLTNEQESESRVADALGSAASASNNNNNNANYLNLQPNMTIIQITNDLPPSAHHDFSDESKENFYHLANTLSSETASADNQQQQQQQIIIRLTDLSSVVENFATTEAATNEHSTNENKTYIDLSKPVKLNYDDEEMLHENIDEQLGNHAQHHAVHHRLNEIDGSLEYLSERELLDLKNMSCSPMIFSTKLLLKLFAKEELIGHNLSAKSYSTHVTRNSARNSNNANNNGRPFLDENRINYIRNMVEKYFILMQQQQQQQQQHANTRSAKNIEDVWMSCRKAINRVIRNFEIKESKLIKSIEADLGEDEDEALMNSDFLPSTHNCTSNFKIMILNDENSRTEMCS